ncbi:MAG TPA: nuclear transport factor 2 family protein [Rhizomicrobium sp.]
MTDTFRDEAQIRSILNEAEKALYSKDADAIVAHYADDIVIANLAPPLCRQGAAARDTAGIEQWLDTWKGPIGWEARDLHIEIGGDIAFAHGLNRMSGTKRDGGTPVLWTRSTYCFRRENGEWKIVHNHNSVPFYMDGSFRAATDLKP